MEILFLGTGGVNGVPAWSCNCRTCKLARVEKDKNLRTRSSIIIKDKNKTICIDAGPDFRTQMLRENTTYIDNLLLTHAHTDHTASLIDMRSPGARTVEAPAAVWADIDKNHANFKPWIAARNPEVSVKIFKPKKIGSISVDTVELLHSKEIKQLNVSCYGYIFSDGKNKIAYLSDFGKILEPEKLKDLDLFISDGAVMNPSLGHSGIEGGLKVYRELKPKKMLFTHIAHNLPPHDELEKHVKKFGNIGLAYDGMRIKVK